MSADPAPTAPDSDLGWRARLRQWVTPVAGVPEAGRLPAQLLSWLLIATVLMIFMAFVALFAFGRTTGALGGPSFIVAAGSALLLVVAYGLNNAGRHYLAAEFTVAIAAIAVWAVIFLSRAAPSEVPWLLPYLLISVLLASLLLTRRVTAALAVAHLIGMAFLPAFFPGLYSPSYVRAVVFDVFMAALIIAAAIAHWRNRAQIEHQTRRLAEEENRFRIFFDYSPDAILLIDPHDPDADWPIVACNEATLRMNGYMREEIIGQSIDILNASPSRPGERAEYLERLRREGRLHLEALHRRSDGTEFPVEISTSLVTLGGRELVLGVDRDISERKQSEAALRRSEERFELVSYATNDAVWDWDLATGRVWWNRGLGKLFGYAAGDVGEDIAWREARIHPDDREKVINSLRAALDSGEEFWSREYRYRRANGAYAQVFDRGYVIKDEAGQPLRLVGAMMDITDRKRVEDALRESEALFRTSFENSPVGIALVSPGGEYLRVNRSLCDMLGYPEAEMLGRRTSEFMHPDDVPASQAQARRLIAGEIKVADIEKRYLHKSGRVIWAQRIMTGLNIGSEAPRYYISQLHDVTDRRQAQEELTASNQQLTRWLAELEQRTREMATLNELVSLFQNCHSPEEAYVVVAKLAPDLFPGDAGSLSVIPPSHNMVETMARWGHLSRSATIFQIDDCWALRRAQPHVVLNSHRSLVCDHLTEVPAAYLCVPLFAQGEMLGCFHLGTAAGQLSDSKQQLVKTVADDIALSLANLRLRESLRQQSIIDVLTGLFNRRYMEETLEREVRRCARAGHPLGVIMIDIDHFKAFNDAHGHGAGDVLLAELGEYLRARVRTEDIACRYGGEEFTVILPDSSLEVTAQRAEELHRGLHALRVEYGGQVIGSASLSMGVAAFPGHGLDGAEVLRAADNALYSAKRQGRDRVVVAQHTALDPKSAL